MVGGYSADTLILSLILWNCNAQFLNLQTQWVKIKSIPTTTYSAPTTAPLAGHGDSSKSLSRFDCASANSAAQWFLWTWLSNQGLQSIIRCIQSPNSKIIDTYTYIYIYIQYIYIHTSMYSHVYNTLIFVDIPNQLVNVGEIFYRIMELKLRLSSHWSTKSGNSHGIPIWPP